VQILEVVDEEARDELVDAVSGVEPRGMDFDELALLTGDGDVIALGGPA
jgi:hypothetical protein